MEDQLVLAMGFKDELEVGGYRVLALAIRRQEALGFAREDKPDLAESFPGPTNSEVSDAIQPSLR